jgi:ESAT-6 family protein
MTEIKYVRGAIDGVVGAIGQAGNDIDRELAELYREFTNLFGTSFQGEAGQAFQEAQRKWDAGAQQVKQALATLGPKLGTAGDDIFSTDRQIASGIG